MTSVAVLDYGMGNLHSVAKALEHVGATKVVITDDVAIIRAADRVVLPGQGAMRDCMAAMHEHGIADLVDELIHSKPLLGICVGMQAMLTRSDENGGVDGLGLYPGHVKFFTDVPAVDAQRLKVPHMGWNTVSQVREHPLWDGIADGSRFYFVHSYYCQPDDPALSVGSCDYGLPFSCAIAKDNVFAVQFHPEKSAHDGLRLLQNFLRWNP
ncbi:imidazole glycerol phosphate synthase subunit HisH [Paraperlucidibaca wandonensis]|uniref:Imidazole glycerol phosphate synthase subunit HisH n=1 Tax=Paraperlucidibaca wandonensis TaxID=1268273 RepID=A0ABW3HIZ4_9GAMM|nr:imidazole glycerol phosphate synthase subunit HisH [Paraperlucidibaca sp.]MBQ0723636.1 imidazole glycerol phosphate synthase subunit HisH [Paraperlucidibaca sp.]MBQ0842859.1 imidazole glycerol phosphate synthase subunit HisH [Paraperlucidibaca sp.]